jgi:DNA-binding response OmpR family regulator
MKNDGTLKILMADDEPDILNIMAKKVAQAGYTVITAGDGEEALAKINSEHPDVILLDLNMPKMDGFTVLKYIRENPPSAKWQPVIIVSARTELDDMKKGFSLEADHYIPKPCNVTDILKGIRLMVNLIPQRKTKEESEK